VPPVDSEVFVGR
jgi:hypothetical protein